MAAPDRPLSARSVVASTLLGTDPPELPAAALVRVGALFDMGEGTMRTALSRMASGGELDRVDDGRYRLAGDLLIRAGIQSVSRAAAVTTWSGRWRQAIVLAGPRSASERSNLRRAMTRLRYGELRDGVWLRPDNLDPQRWPDAHDIVDEQCRWFAVSPDHDDDLASSLWDLDAWAGARHRAPPIHGRPRRAARRRRSDRAARRASSSRPPCSGTSIPTRCCPTNCSRDTGRGTGSAPTTTATTPPTDACWARTSASADRRYG